MRLIPCLFFLLLLSAVPRESSAQQQRVFAILEADTSLKVVRLQRVNMFNSEKKREDFLRQMIADLHRSNWLEASVDSIAGVGEDTILVFLHVGKKYQLQSQVPDMLSYSKGRNGKNGSGLQQPEYPESVVQTLLSIEQQLTYWQEHGYPFAFITWDTLTLIDDSLSMKAVIDKGPLIVIDSVINREDAKISESFLKSYLGVSKDMPYKESLLDQSDQLLRKLPFARFTRPSTIYFQGDKATMNVYLANRKVSRFDFLVGVLPNNTNTGKVLITGEARVQLMNAFKQGEEIFMEWKRVQVNSQQLRLRFNYPYLFNTPIGVNAFFRLDKRDSTFLDLEWSFGIPFRTKANNYIKAMIENDQTIVLQTDTLFVQRFNQLPRIQDISTLLYGFEGYFENLDHLFNPRKGIELLASAQVGTRRIKPSSAILNLGEPFTELYDTLDLKTIQMQFKAMFNAYFSIGKMQVIKLGFRGESKLNRNVLDNELFRIGGANVLRGFDEESLFIQHYGILTGEYRFILGQNSYMYAFVDAAYTGRPTLEGYQHDFPLGFGAGMAFETKAGIFGLSYALGRQQGNPIDFRTSKLHFGYINIF
jgi:outer membrane protein assembly factor BamA